MSDTKSTITDAEVVDDTGAELSGTEVAPATGVALAITTPVQASDLVERLATISEAMANAMKRDVDYGVVPNTDKPALFKAGAEKLAVLFQLDVQTTHAERVGPGDHLTVPAYSMVYHAPTGTRLGRGEGLCSTRERKYAYRNRGRECPSCGKDAIIKGKQEYGGGWVCFKKKGGCSAKFPDGAQEIEAQTVGEIDNPDLPDLWNTVIKMARKRAFVDAVLLVTGASALFTQDVEDAVEPVVTTAVASGPPFGPPADGELIEKIETALGYMLGVDRKAEDVKTVLGVIYRENGYYPLCVLRAIGLTAGQMLKMRNSGASEDQVARAEQLATEHQPLEPGSVSAPVLGGVSEEADIKALRDAGCICRDPLAPANDECSIRGHGIEF